MATAGTPATTVTATATAKPAPAEPDPSAGDVLTAVATIAAALLAARIAVAAYRHERWKSNRDHLAQQYAGALQAIHDYLEAPYRIRRRIPNNDEGRVALTSSISDIQSRIKFHQSWFRVHSPNLAEAYDGLIETVRREAGAQMKTAWIDGGTSRDADVSLHVPLDQKASNKKLDEVTALLRAALEPKQPWWKRKKNATTPPPMPGQRAQPALTTPGTPSSLGGDTCG
jgi:hypothetical protein